MGQLYIEQIFISRERCLRSLGNGRWEIIPSDAVRIQPLYRFKGECEEVLTKVTLSGIGDKVVGVHYYGII